MSLLSKTSFLKFDQCTKAFFLYKKHPYLRDPISREKQFTFNRGHEVGKLAQQLFPGGVDVSEKTKNSLEAYELTQKLITEKALTIYEATFIYNGVLVMVDILHFDGSKWIAYEVKSSLKVSEVYVKDACLQYYVLKNSLELFDDLFIVTLNGNYILEGELNIKLLFKKRSVKANAEENLEFFRHKIEHMKLVLERNVIPDIPIGKHCFSPYDCDFLGTCWRNTNAPGSVFNIGKSNLEQLLTLYFSGADTVDKIAETTELKPNMKIQVESIKTGEPYIDKTAVRNLIEKVSGKFCFLDMEIWSAAVPKYQGTSPFEQIPFLFSVCYKTGGEIQFRNFLKPIENEARELFLQEIITALDGFDSILVFDKNLEDQVFNKLASLFPQYSDAIKELKKKMIDLAGPIQEFSFYHPKFAGNFSLKAVAGIFNEESQYSAIEIQSGIVAMHKYQAMLYEPSALLNDQTKEQLIEYCNLDTLTCLKFFEYLEEKIKD